MILLNDGMLKQSVVYSSTVGVRSRGLKFGCGMVTSDMMHRSCMVAWSLVIELAVLSSRYDSIIWRNTMFCVGPVHLYGVICRHGLIR